MDPVPRLLGSVLVGLALAVSSGSALAGDTASGTLVASSAPLAHSAQDPLVSTDTSPRFQAPPQNYDHQNGVDFFSVRPKAGSSDFTSLLGSSAGGGGLKLHLNW